MHSHSVFIDIKRRLGRMRRNMARPDSRRWGQDFIREVRQRVRRDVKTIFDVGGHCGESALRFSDAFPNAEIYTFEPSTESFERMEMTLRGKPEVKRLNMALGNKVGLETFSYDAAHPYMSRIGTQGLSSRQVAVSTVDEFSRGAGIDQIGILKIDTEGYELNVLAGAANMMASGEVDIIKLECGLTQDNRYHVYLGDVLAFMEEREFRVFGFYDQWESTSDPKPDLRRVDIAFVARHIWNV